MARVFNIYSSGSAGKTQKRTTHAEEPTSYTPHRITLPTANHAALFMPARIVEPSLAGTTIKVVCVPRDTADGRGLPATTLVLEETSGVVKAIINARELTALRNAAGSLLSTNLVGPRTPRKIVAFGSGKQMKAHLDLHIRFFPSIKEVVIINRTINSRALQLKASLSKRFPEVTIMLLGGNGAKDVIEHAVNTADIIICATSSTVPLFPSSWVQSGTHIILIGSYTPAMHEVDTDLVKRALPSGTQMHAALLVDSWSACSSESGELIDAKVVRGHVTEIGELVPITVNGEIDMDKLEFSVQRLSDENTKHDFTGPVTMFKSVGLGIQDVAIACAVVKKAEEMGVGTKVEGYDSDGDPDD